MVLTCSFEGYLLYLVSAIISLPFLHVSLFHVWNAGYPGGGGTSAPCSTGIAWTGRGISDAVA